MSRLPEPPSEDPKSPRLSLQSWIVITSALIMALGQFAGKLVPSISPDTAKSEAKIEELQNKTSRLELELEKVKGRVYTLEHDSGYDGTLGDDGTGYRHGSKRQQ